MGIASRGEGTHSVKGNTVGQSQTGKALTTDRELPYDRPTTHMRRLFRNFLRVVNAREKNELDESALRELKRWGREKVLRNDQVLEEYLTYRQVLHDCSKFLSENEEKSEGDKIETVANYVGLTTVAAKRGRSTHVHT